MAINKIMVVGAGQMGSGIAQVAAQHGFDVVLNDLRPDLAEKGMAAIERRLESAHAKGKITAQDRATTLARIVPSTTLADAAGVDLVIEAASEDLAVKEEIFRTLDRVAPPEAILASNTSSLAITKLAAATGRPDRVIGMHFMNPVPAMALVEVIRGLATSDETSRAVAVLAGRLGKTAVAVGDSPGFVANRVLMPMINEAIFCIHEGVASAQVVDQVMKLGAHHPMGPLALADFIGLDTCLAIMEVLYRDFADSKYRPCPLLRKMVQAGWLGKKSGKGFYDYP